MSSINWISRSRCQINTEMIHYRNERENYISSAVAFNCRCNDYVKVFWINWINWNEYWQLANTRFSIFQYRPRCHNKGRHCGR